MPKRKQVEGKYWRSGSYIQLHMEITDSSAYRDLTCTERCLLHEFQLICFPLNRNGKLSISVSNAVKLLGCSKKTAMKAFHALHNHGFLRLNKGEMWQDKKAREWRLTIMPMGYREPTDEWKNWPNEQTSSGISILRVEDRYQSGS